MTPLQHHQRRVDTPYMTKTLAITALYATILLGGATAAGTYLTDTCPTATTTDLTQVCAATADLPLLGR